MKSVFEKGQLLMGVQVIFFEASAGPSRFQNKWLELLVWGTFVQKKPMTKYLHQFCLLLSLFWVLERFLQSYYPNNGMYKYKKTFAHLLAPRTDLPSEKSISPVLKDEPFSSMNMSRGHKKEENSTI